MTQKILAALFIILGLFGVYSALSSTSSDAAFAVKKKAQRPLPKFIGNPYWECINNGDQENDCESSPYATWDFNFQVSLCSDGANRVWMWENTYSRSGFWGKLPCNQTSLIGDDLEYGKKLFLQPVYQVNYKAKRKGKLKCWSIAFNSVERVKC